MRDIPKIPVWLALGIAAVAIILWRSYAEPPPPVYMPGPTSVHTVYKPKYTEKIKRDLVPVHAQIEFFRHEDVVKKVRDAPDNVIALGEVPPHTGKTTVLAHLRQEDNVLRGSLTYRQEPPPFFQMKRELGIRGGYGTSGIMGEVYVRPLRIGPAEVEARVYGHTTEPTVGAAILVDVKF